MHLFLKKIYRKNPFPKIYRINQCEVLSRADLKGFLKKEVPPSGLYPESLKAYQRNHVCQTHTSRRIESETMAGLRFKTEYRYPMADIRLLQYVLSIPMEQKITSTTNRSIYRRAMKGYLPDSIRLRDMKYKGSLKTTHLMEPMDHQETSKLALWENIKNANAAPFMNQDLVEKFIQSKRSPYGLYQWMILGQLGVQGRFNF